MNALEMKSPVSLYCVDAPEMKSPESFGKMMDVMDTKYGSEREGPLMHMRKYPATWILTGLLVIYYPAICLTFLILGSICPMWLRTICLMWLGKLFAELMVSIEETVLIKNRGHPSDEDEMDTRKLEELTTINTDKCTEKYGMVHN